MNATAPASFTAASTCPAVWIDNAITPMPALLGGRMFPAWNPRSATGRRETSCAPSDGKRPRGVPSTSEIEAHGWRREDVALRLGIKDVEEWHQRIEGSDAYPTLYEISLTDLRDIGN